MRQLVTTICALLVFAVLVSPVVARSKRNERSQYKWASVNATQFPGYVKAIVWNNGRLSGGGAASWGAWSVTFPGDPPVFDFDPRDDTYKLGYLRCTNAVLGDRGCIMYLDPIKDLCRLFVFRAEEQPDLELDGRFRLRPVLKHIDFKCPTDVELQTRENSSFQRSSTDLGSQTETRPDSQRSNPETVTTRAKRFNVQVGLFNRDGSHATVKKLHTLGYEATILTETHKEQVFYKVQLGPYSTRKQATLVAEQLAEELDWSPVVTKEQ